MINTLTYILQIILISLLGSNSFEVRTYSSSTLEGVADFDTILDIGANNNLVWKIYKDPEINSRVRNLRENKVYYKIENNIVGKWDEFDNENRHSIWTFEHNNKVTFETAVFHSTMKYDYYIKGNEIVLILPETQYREYYSFTYSSSDIQDYKLKKGKLRLILQRIYPDDEYSK